MVGDLNLFFDSSLEASGGSPTLKKKSISNFLQFVGKHNLIDIWRIRNPKSKRFTFRQNHFSGFLQRRLDYVFVSNTLQEIFIIWKFYLHFVVIIHQVFFLTKDIHLFAEVTTFGNLIVVLLLMTAHNSNEKSH